MQRDDVITTAFWLFIPTVVGMYTQDIKHTLIAVGIVTVFMPLQLWVFAKGMWYTAAWVYRVASRLLTRKAGKFTPLPETGIIAPPAEVVDVRPEGSD